MSNEYVNKNINEIFSSKDFDFPLNSAMAAAWSPRRLCMVERQTYPLNQSGRVLIDERIYDAALAHSRDLTAAAAA